MSIYFEILKYIDNILINLFNITRELILKYNQSPLKHENFFIRKVWNGGTLYLLGNITYLLINILNLEVYLRKRILSSKIESLVHKLRKELISKIINDPNTNSRAKIYNISIIPNLNLLNWNSYTISISIRIKWEFN